MGSHPSPGAMSAAAAAASSVGSHPSPASLSAASPAASSSAGLSPPPASPSSGAAPPVLPPVGASAAAGGSFVPATIDGRRAYKVNTTPDGRDVYEPQRPDAPVGETSPEPHFTRDADGSGGHVSDLTVHTPPSPGGTVRMKRTYQAYGAGSKPKPENRNFYNTATGGSLGRDRTSPGLAAPSSPTTLRNTTNRHGVVFGGSGAAPPSLPAAPTPPPPAASSVLPSSASSSAAASSSRSSSSSSSGSGGSPSGGSGGKS